MTDKTVNGLAMELMCALYRKRVSKIVDVQVATLRRLQSPTPVQLYPPTQEEFSLIGSALEEARDAGLHAAMGLIVQECDHWTAKGAKARIEALLEDVRTLKSSSLAVAG